MQKRFCLSILALLIGISFLFGQARQPFAAMTERTLAQSGEVHCPTVKLDHWRNSTRDEKLSFLFGFASLLEMERDWQGRQALPVRQSIIPSWGRGLDGVPLGRVADSIDEYAASHPEEHDISVLQVIGSLYVRPKMTQAEIADAERRVRQSREPARMDRELGRMERENSGMGR